MELISVTHRNELIDGARKSLKLELWDYYASDAELFEAWRSGDNATVHAVIEQAASDVRATVARGRRGRRVKVVSEPLSEYHKFTLEASGALVEAGELLRWLPRKLTSTLAFPGNDCMVIDDKAVIFNVLDSSGTRIEIQFFDDPEVVKSCTERFEAAWELAIPHDQYRPAT